MGEIAEAMIDAGVEEEGVEARYQRQNRSPDDEIEVDEQTGEILPAMQTAALSQMPFDPELAIERGERASKSLMRMIEAREQHFLAQIRGKPFLKYEAWAMIAAFFGEHAEIVAVNEIMEGDDVVGYQAHAAIVSPNGRVGSPVRMECRFGEDTWKGWNQDALPNAVASKAQTRAMAKALRGKYSWVAALGGYETTPAEEMESVPQRQERAQPPRREAQASRTSPNPQRAENAPQKSDTDADKDRARKAMFATYRELYDGLKAHGVDDPKSEMFRQGLHEWFGVESTNDMTVGKMGGMTEKLKKIASQGDYAAFAKAILDAQPPSEPDEPKDEDIPF